MHMTSAKSQPISDCGPLSADISNGIVMNGPTPTILLMFRAVACRSPKRRCKCGESFTGREIARNQPARKVQSAQELLRRKVRETHPTRGQTETICFIEPEPLLRKLL